jgi:hypothetical protein
MLMTGWPDFSVYLMSGLHSKRPYRNAYLVAGEFAEGIGRCNPRKFMKLLHCQRRLLKTEGRVDRVNLVFWENLIIQRFRKKMDGI